MTKITVNKKAVESLKSIKKKNENFSDVINRMSKLQIFEYCGSLSEESAKKIKENRKELNKSFKSRLNRTKHALRHLRNN